MPEPVLVLDARCAKPQRRVRWSVPDLFQRRALTTTVLTVLLVAVSAAFVPRPAGFVVLVGLLGYGSWRLALAVFRPATVADATMLTWTLALAWVGLVAEILSLGRLLGHEVAWLVGVASLTLLMAWLPPGMSSGPLHARAATLDGLLASLPLVGRLVLVAFALQLTAAFILTWFVGINISDSIATYMPRSLLMVQEGTVAASEPSVGFLQYLHQVVVAVQLLFVRSDVLVNVFSFATAGMAALGIFTFVRSMLPAHARHGWLPLAVALLPFTMPLFLLHASASNFDIFTGQWLLFALYFLRRGYAATSPRWLVAAALATGLALATKPTFWFAAPGLGLIWLWTLARPLLKKPLHSRSRQVSGETAGAAPATSALASVQGGRVVRAADRRASAMYRGLRTAVVCAVVVIIVGTPFLWRNVLGEGFLIAPPDRHANATSTDHSSDYRLRRLVFNGAALGLMLLTPPSLLPEAIALKLDGKFGERMRALGFTLPDPQVTPHLSWQGLIRHAHYRYDSNHASFGAAFVLVTIPGLVLLPFARRWLGPTWPFAVATGLFSASYFIAQSVLTHYYAAHIRYLLEMVIPLTILAPLSFLALPPRLRGPLAVALALPLLLEMHGVIRNNRFMPPDRVMSTPRMDQLYAFSAGSLSIPEASREFARKYPASEYPDIWVETGGSDPFFSFTFFGPALERRLHYWDVRQGGLPPGPILVYDATGAERLIKAGMIPDLLAGRTFLMLPNDRLRVRLLTVRSDVATPARLRLEASIPPGRYRDPQFGYFLLDGGATVPLREFSPEPTFELPIEQAQRGTIRVDVRDGAGGRAAERTQISSAVLASL